MIISTTDLVSCERTYKYSHEPRENHSDQNWPEGNILQQTCISWLRVRQAQLHTSIWSLLPDLHLLHVVVASKIKHGRSQYQKKGYELFVAMIVMVNDVKGIHHYGS